MVVGFRSAHQALLDLLALRAPQVHLDRLEKMMVAGKVEGVEIHHLIHNPVL
jgi:hypothetical protein